MNLLLLIVVATMVGLTTMGALVWAYFAEDRAFAPKPTKESDDSHDRVSA